MSSKPTTIVILPGACHQPVCFNTIVPRLEKHFHVHAVSRPSAGPEAPSKCFDDDVRFVRALITECVQRGERVFVLCHSAGGFVAAPSIAGLTVQERRQAGKQGGVTGLGYMAAFLAPKDGMLFEGVNHRFSAIEFITPTTMVFKDPIPALYHDLPRPEAEYWVQQLVPSSFVPVRELAYEGWRDVPVYYLLCEDDPVLLPSTQAAMVEKSRAQGAQIHVTRVKSGHSPFLSMPEATADWVTESVKLAEDELARTAKDPAKADISVAITGIEIDA